MNETLDLSPFFHYGISPMFVLDDKCTMIEVNQAGCEMLASKYENIVGQPMWHFLPKTFRNESLTRWQNFLQTKEQNGIFVASTTDESVQYVKYRAIANAINNQYHLAIIENTSDKLDIETELAARELRYRNLNALYPVGIFHADIDGNDVYVNDKACEIMGLSAEECMGSGWRKNLHPDDYGRVVNGWLTAMSETGHFNMEYRFIQPDGAVRWVHGQSVAEYNEEGNISHYIGTLTDITKLRQAENEATRAQAELAKVSRLSAIGEMASGIAHELNQPLTAITNYISGCQRRLQQNELAPEINHAMQQIVKQANRAGEIIHHLKDFLHRGELQKKLCNINQLVEQTISFLETSFEQNNVAIVTCLEENIPELLIDTINIQQVIVNLITNAIDAINESQPRDRHIAIYTKTVNEFAEIHISDTGPGIPEKLKTKIFNPFFTTKDSGTGIGLALSKTIIERHDGELTLCDNDSNRSCFKIILPTE